MDTQFWVAWLPAVNASLNGLATVFLTAGFIIIKRDPEGGRNRHRAAMLGAFCVSVVFLVCYVAHKYLRAALGEDINTTFAGEGIWRAIYYPMLLSHVLLAMVIVPLVLITLYHAVRGHYATHRAWARWTFPIWYYVSITGVLVYFFIYQWFPA